MESLGKHILVEFIGCDSETLNNVCHTEKSMVEAAKRANATVINSTFHHFSPFGVSGVVVIQESHLAIHTWPEFQYAAVDLFTCGDTVDPWISFDFLKKAFKAKNYSAIEMRRGNMELLKRVDFDMQKKGYTPNVGLNGKTKYNRNVWLTDKDENQALSLRHTGNILYDKTSAFQQTRVFESYAYGNLLAIDNMVMTTDKDEFHYHEMISHPAILSHGNIKNVLIIGGGDGGSAREVLRHKNIEKVVMVEIDKNVVEAAKLHLPKLSSALENPKLELLIADGIEYVSKADSNIFDLVIVDGSDPVGPAEGLFSEKFFKDCKRITNENGLVITQGESPYFNQKAFADLNNCFKSIFGKEKVSTLLFHIPTYPSGTWSFHIASNGKVDPKIVDKNISESFTKEQKLKYYNYQIHNAAFALPGFINEMLGNE